MEPDNEDIAKEKFGKDIHRDLARIVALRPTDFDIGNRLGEDEDAAGSLERLAEAVGSELAYRVWKRNAGMSYGHWARDLSEAELERLRERFGRRKYDFDMPKLAFNGELARKTLYRAGAPRDVVAHILGTTKRGAREADLPPRDLERDGLPIVRIIADGLDAEMGLIRLQNDLADLRESGAPSENLRTSLLAVCANVLSYDYRAESFGEGWPNSRLARGLLFQELARADFDKDALRRLRARLEKLRHLLVWFMRPRWASEQIRDLFRNDEYMSQELLPKVTELVRDVLRERFEYLADPRSETHGAGRELVKTRARAKADAEIERRLHPALAQGARAVQKEPMAKSATPKASTSSSAKAGAPKARTSKPSTSAPKASRPRKLGRPARVGEASDEAVRIRLSSAERATIERAAHRAGKTLAAFVRDAALRASE